MSRPTKSTLAGRAFLGLRGRAGGIRQALRIVARHRRVELAGLDDALAGYADIGQARWTLWRSKPQLADVLPADFGEALDSLRAFANPLLTGSATDDSVWDPGRRTWNESRPGQGGEG